MTRLRLLPAMVFVLGMPSLVHANPDCQVFGQIADRAVAEREEGTEMMDAMVKIAEGFSGNQQRFAGAVPLLVDWVWNLPADQLNDGVGAAYREACENQ